MIDFKHFKKVSEDDKVATMKHPSGHEVKIVKSSLSPQHQKQLASLPLHQSDPDSAVGESMNDDSDKSSGQSSHHGPITINVGAPQASPKPDVDQELASIQPPQLQAPQAQATPQDLSSPPLSDQQPPLPADNMQPGQLAPQADQQPSSPNLEPYKQLPEFQFNQAAALESKKAAEDYGHNMATAAHTQQQDLQRIEDQRKALTTDTLHDMQTTMQDIKDGAIQPNHYLENKSVPGKIATALGLMLGGYGAGLTHGPNMAQQFLQSQIDRDLEAQKANLNSKHTLLGALQTKYKDINTASEMQRGISNLKYASHLQELAAKYGVDTATPQFQQSMASFIGPARDSLMKVTEMRMRQGAEGGSQGDAAQNYLQYARVMNPKAAEEFEKRYVPGVGVAQVPLEKEDKDSIESLQNMAKLMPRVQASLDKHSTLGPTMFSPADKQEAKFLQGQLTGNMHTLLGMKNPRISEQALQLFDKGAPGLTGTHFTNADQSAVDNINQTIADELNTIYSTKGINRRAEAIKRVK